MSEIDWDKAPEGCTHYVAGSIAPFEKREGDKWSYWSGRRREWIAISAIGDDRLTEGLHTIVERPYPAWSGEGLPPVGVVCEANFVGEWTRFEMRYYGEAYVVFKTAFEVQRTRHDFDTCGVKFRQIRTPEQIAADEREAAIKEMTANYAKNYDTLAGWAAYVYDTLGYRKP